MFNDKLQVFFSKIFQLNYKCDHIEIADCATEISSFESCMQQKYGTNDYKLDQELSQQSSRIQYVFETYESCFGKSVSQFDLRAHNN